MASKKIYFSKEGFKKLEAELSDIQHNKKPALSEEIAEARQKGDLSENAEYHAAREALSFVIARESIIQSQLANAVIVDKKDIDTSKVAILTKVTIKNVRMDKKVTYELVAEQEANLQEGKISVSSPIGKGLLGKKKGESVTIEIPAGNVTFEILDISL